MSIEFFSFFSHIYQSVFIKESCTDFSGTLFLVLSNYDDCILFVRDADIDSLLRYITPTPIQYKPSNDGESCDIRNQLSPTSPNSECRLFILLF